MTLPNPNNNCPECNHNVYNHSTTAGCVAYIDKNRIKMCNCENTTISIAIRTRNKNNWKQKKQERWNGNINKWKKEGGLV